MTALNYWHFIVIGVILLSMSFGIYASLKQKSVKLRTSMLFSVLLIHILIGVFSIFVVDKYTKKASLYKVKNRRILSTETIAYSGFVKNSGNHTIGKVTFEVKIVNKGSATGNIKGGSFYKSSGFFDFFSSGADVLYKPQSITKEFVVAKNLKPGEVKSFHVYFKFPPYFRNVSHFTKVYAH